MGAKSVISFYLGLNFPLSYFYLLKYGQTKCINTCLSLIRGDNNGRTLVWRAKKPLNEGSTVLAFYIIMLILQDNE